MAKITFEEVASAPAAPATGKLVLYAKTDDALYIKNDADIETAIGVSNAIDVLTGDVSATGPGTVAATVNTVGGETAADIATSVNDTQAATSSNTPSTIVKRDGSGNFSAGTITASLTGNVTGNVSGSSASITGINPIANGGTNSSTALNNDRVMKSSGGAIVEASVITGNRALASDASGIPVHTTTTDTELNYVSGVTSAIQTQINTKVTGPASATDTALTVYDGTTGKLVKNSVHTVDSSNRLNMGAAFVSKVVSLTDAATIATDASLGNIFMVTLGGNRTLGAPTNPIQGQKITYKIRQDGTGSRTLAFDSVFRFGLDILAPTLSTGANKVDYIGFIYNSTDTKWDCLAVTKGF